MKVKTLEKINAELADDKISVVRWRSKKRFASANYLVRVKTGAARVMPDGSKWDGYEHVAHCETIGAAVECARKAAYERRG